MGRVDTVLPADSVEFRPCPTGPQIFVCGTYQLEEAPPAIATEPDHGPTSPSASQRRRGKCLVYQVGENEDECTQLQAITMPAVLDMKWSSDFLAIADAEGRINLQRWQDESRRLEHLQTLTCISEDPSAICLSLDWRKNRSEQHSDMLSVSLSNGSVLIAHQSSAGLDVTDVWHAHEFEPWITAWDRWDVNIIYTGGDDCQLKAWDVRAGFNQPVFINKRFDAGVTTIQSSPHLEHTLAVGRLALLVYTLEMLHNLAPDSYDSTVRLFDIRQPFQTLTQADVGGGAWRVKWHPEASRRHHLLVACMHDGFKVVDFEPGAGKADAPAVQKWQVLSRFDEHTSLAYGVDWSYAPASQAGTLVASCSFYDHSLHLWRG